MREQGRGIRTSQSPAINSMGKDLGFTSFEEFLLEWSVATVGRSWSVIAEILHSYPLASGQQLDAAKIPELYSLLKTRKGKFFHKSTRLDPTEDDGIPVLGRFKPYLLMNRMLPVYPQQFALVCDYLDKDESKEEFKLSGKRKMQKLNLPSDYEIRDLKYKCCNDLNPIPLLMRDTQLKTSISGESMLEHERDPLNAKESLISNTPIYQLAKIFSKQEIVDPIKRRKEQLKGLFQCKMIKEEPVETINNRTDSSSTFKWNFPNLLENLFFYYQDIFRCNWNSMTNTWFQNNRSIAMYARKPGTEQQDKNQPPQNIMVKTEHPSIPYSGSAPSAGHNQQSVMPRKL